MKKSLLCSSLISLLLAGCGNWNIKSGTSGIAETSSGGFSDNDTGDIIRQEIDESGRLRDCTVGKTSDRRELPSCNDIVNRQKAKDNQDAEVSQGMLRNKLDGSKLFTLPNGAQIRISTASKYNDSAGESGELIINVLVEKVNATDSVFENLFISSRAFVDIGFYDRDDFQLLTPLQIPLNIENGQRQNVNYTKKFGQTTSQVVGVRMQARKPIKNIREYQEISRLEVAFRPN